MVNYQEAKIYKIINDELPGMVYYGSTTIKYLSNRLGKHRYLYKHNKHFKTSAVKLFEIGLPKIILIENYPCKTKDELLSRERFYIENNDCVNRCTPGGTQKDYYFKNKEHLALKAKEYYIKNKERIKQQSKLNKIKRQIYD
tara:strand:+ start:270 stop:695 length:426 start_codon:yes stop_codon:yes gene_type:complete